METKCKFCGGNSDRGTRFCSNSCYLNAVSKYYRKLKDFRQKTYRELFGS